MPKTGVANLPLHPGKAPSWLFKRMVALSKGISEVIVYEYGTDEFLRRLSDPFWFQALACVLAWDWHSSGATTVTCGALKEAINPEDFGLAFAGGKGKASQNTLSEIEIFSDKYNFSTPLVERLQYCSRMTAKVDNTAIQDGHTLYHHMFILSENKKWAVIQQGLNNQTSYARRYHWLSDDARSFICEPHTTIVGEARVEKVLDMTAKQSTAAQKVSVDLINDNPSHLRREWANLSLHQDQKTLDDWQAPHRNKHTVPHLDMPQHTNWQKMKEIYDVHPKDYEELLALKGIGPKTVRGLALISELIYGEKPSWDDPVRFTFAYGGKDGVPRFVDRKEMDESIEIIHEGINQARIGEKEKLQALRRLKDFLPGYSS
jgi:hypothetical protein